MALFVVSIELAMNGVLCVCVCVCVCLTLAYTMMTARITLRNTNGISSALSHFAISLQFVS